MDVLNLPAWAWSCSAQPDRPHRKLCAGVPSPDTPFRLTLAQVQSLEPTPPSTPSPDAEPSNPANTAIVGALAHMVQFYGLQGPYTGDMDEVLDVDYSDLLSSA